MEVLIKDLEQALRMLRRSPGFALAAIAALALGIALTTAIFAVVNTVLLKPLTYPEPGRIVQVINVSPNGRYPWASIAKFNFWRTQTSVFEEVAAYDEGSSGANVTGGAYPEQVRAMDVSADYFPLLGARAILGRTFTAEDDRPHAGHPVVPSYDFWQRHYGGNPKELGQTIAISGDAHTVVGVIRREFLPDQPVDIWLPDQFDPNSHDQAHFFHVIARLKRGVTLDQANAQIAIAAQEFRRLYPVFPANQTFAVERLQDHIVGNVRTSLLILSGAAGFVLLIACANVANLLLARAAGRKKEIAIRAAIGAGRGRLIRQLLTESVLLFFLGGLAGTMLGVIGIRALLAVNPGNIPRIGESGSSVTLDWYVLAFALGVSLLTGLIFGLISALGISRANLGATMKEASGRTGPGLRGNSTRSLLVTGEFALALVLLCGAALLIRTFVALRIVDPGFDPDNVLTMQVALNGSRFQKTAPVAAAIRTALDRIQALPSVASAGASCCLPLEGAFSLGFLIPGKQIPGTRNGQGNAGYIPVSPGFFETFRIPMIQGRSFDVRDNGSAAPVVIINQTFARKFWPKENPVGQQLLISPQGDPAFREGPRQIIAVAGDLRDSALNLDPSSEMYIPIAQMPDGVTAMNARVTSTAFEIRTRTDPHSLSRAIQKEIEGATARCAHPHYG